MLFQNNIVIAVPALHKCEKMDSVSKDNLAELVVTKCRQACQHVANNDLFKSIFDNILLKNIDITVRWMPSHLTDKLDNPDFVLPENVTVCDIKGNQWADELCGKAAKNAKLPMHITTPIIYYKNLIIRIQRRLVAILCALPNRNKHTTGAPKAVIPHDNVNTLIDISEHILFEALGKVHCIRCSNVFFIVEPEP